MDDQYMYDNKNCILMEQPYICQNGSTLTPIYSKDGSNIIDYTCQCGPSTGGKQCQRSLNDTCNGPTTSGNNCTLCNNTSLVVATNCTMSFYNPAGKTFDINGPFMRMNNTKDIEAYVFMQPEQYPDKIICYDTAKQQYYVAPLNIYNNTNRQNGNGIWCWRSGTDTFSLEVGDNTKNYLTLGKTQWTASRDCSDTRTTITSSTFSYSYYISTDNKVFCNFIPYTYNVSFTSGNPNNFTSTQGAFGSYTSSIPQRGGITCTENGPITYQGDFTFAMTSPTSLLQDHIVSLNYATTLRQRWMFTPCINNLKLISISLDNTTLYLYRVNNTISLLNISKTEALYNSACWWLQSNITKTPNYFYLQNPFNGYQLDVQNNELIMTTKARLWQWSNNKLYTDGFYAYSTQTSTGINSRNYIYVDLTNKMGNIPVSMYKASPIMSEPKSPIVLTPLYTIDSSNPYQWYSAYQMPN